MDNISLYRKYRPLFFKDIIGQKEITKSLQNSVKFNSFSHAYIFSGPRGTGKTSLAKIFARTINCSNTINNESCNKCKICELNFKNKSLDIIEIDAASNNGVSDIRDLCEKIQILPSVSKYKVYIIDEVHMLSDSAFNALLKTLEEPPKHSIIILATTEINKIPLTILSRCQRFNFTLLDNEEIFNNITHILNKEDIEYEKSAINEIVNLSDGSMRDALSTLEQVISFDNKKISISNVLSSLKLLNYNDKNTFINSYVNRNAQNIINIKNKILKNSIDIHIFWKDIIKILKNKIEGLIFNDNNVATNELLKLYELFELISKQNNYIFNSNNPILSFEILILDIIKKINKPKIIKTENIPSSEVIENTNNNIIQNDKITVDVQRITTKNTKNIDTNLEKQKTLLQLKEEILNKNNLNNPEYNANIDIDYFKAIFNSKIDKEFIKKIITLIKNHTNKNFLYFYNLKKFPRGNNKGIILVFQNQSDVNYLNKALHDLNTRKIILNKLGLHKICIIALNVYDYENLKRSQEILVKIKKPLNINKYYENLYNNSNINTIDNDLKNIFGNEIKIIK